MKIVSAIFFIVMSSVVLAQIPNSSFENWSSGNPVGWSTGNSIVAGTTTQSANAYIGSSAVELNSVGGLGGFAETGTPTFPYFGNSGNPAALNGWYILQSTNGDVLQVKVGTECSNSANGAATSNISDTTTVYKQFSACLTYTSSCTADSASIALQLVNLTGPTSTGTHIIIDDLSFGACTAGIDNMKSDVTLEASYPNPASTICNIIYAIPNAATTNISLYDLGGRKVMNILGNTRQTPGRYKIPVDVRTLTNGFYFYTIAVDGVVYTQKLAVVK